MTEKQLIGSRTFGIAPDAVFGRNSSARLMFVLFAVAAMLTALADSVLTPLQRPPLADLVVGLLMLRLIFEVKALRRYVWISHWVMMPSLAAVLVIWAQWRRGMPLSEELAWALLPSAAVGIILASLISIPPLLAAFWRLQLGSMRWLPASSAGALFGVLQFAYLQGDPVASIPLHWTSLSTASLLICAGMAVTAASVSWRRLAAGLLLGVLHAATLHWLPALTPATMAALGVWLFKGAFPDREQAIGTSLVIVFAWSSGCAVGCTRVLIEWL